MERIPYFDAHCDTVSLCCYNGSSLADSSGHISLNRTDAFSAYVQLFALFGKIDGNMEERTYAEFVRMHDWLLHEAEVNSSTIALCMEKADVEQAISEGKTAALLSIEESGLLEFDPEKLQQAADWGVRAINLTWNHQNPLSGSNAEAPEQGLTDRGRAFVREAERLHILMDVSHVSPKSFWDLYEMASQPIIASHSNSYSICPHRRNLTDDQFRAIVQSGGVAGLNFYQEFIGGAGDIDTLIRHLEHFLELGGENHIGLGGDLDGCSRVCAGIDNLSGVPNLWSALQARGYSDELLQKLFFDNWFRIILP